MSDPVSLPNQSTPINSLPPSPQTPLVNTNPPLPPVPPVIPPAPITPPPPSNPSSLPTPPPLSPLPPPVLSQHPPLPSPPHTDLPPSPLIPQPTPKKKSSNVLKILIIMILLAVIGVLAFQYYRLKTKVVSPTPSPSLAPSLTSEQVISPELTAEQDATLDPTADWQTYTNKVFNFSFKYPSTFTLTDNLQTSTDPLAWTTKTSLNLVDSVQDYSFSIMINPDGFGPWFPNQLHKLSYSEAEGIFISDTSINEENLTTSEYNLIGSGDFQVGKVVGFLIFASSSDDAQARSYLDITFNQIISTFKFNE